LTEEASQEYGIILSLPMFFVLFVGKTVKLNVIMLTRTAVKETTMETLFFIFAIIGIFFIFRVLAKLFNKVGNALDKFGDALADVSISSAKSTIGHGVSEKDKNKIREKIRTLQGEPTDKEYKDNVQKEIDGLIKGVEK